MHSKKSHGRMCESHYILFQKLSQLLKKHKVVRQGVWHTICQTIGQIGIPYVPFAYRTGDFWTDVFINAVISSGVGVIIHYTFSKKGKKAIKKFYMTLLH